MTITAKKADHEVRLKVVSDPNGTKQIVPNVPASMKVGDTVHYGRYGKAPGVVTIDFRDKGSPFLDDHGNEIMRIKSTDGPQKLAKTGDFPFGCSIELMPKILSSGKQSPGEIIVTPGYASGGNMVVRAQVK